MADEQGTTASEFNKLDAKRTSILNRARECSELTLPALLPRLGFDENTELPQPYNSLSAKGINNLAAKLLLALLPVNEPFFELTVDRKTLNDLLAQDESIQVEIDSALSGMEKITLDEIATRNFRSPLFYALKLLITIGNALLHHTEDGNLVVFRLDQYVVKRDPAGSVVCLILKETVNPSTLPENIREIVLSDTNIKDKGDDETLDLYTEIELSEDGKKWIVTQEIEGKEIEESSGEYDLDECPYVVCRWSAIAGEDYGRGLVEEFLGDIRSLESLTKSIVEGSAAAAKVLFLNNPNGVTKTQTVAKAKNGDIISGKRDDIGTLQVDKFNDFRVALETMAKIEQRLAQSFMMMSSIQRDAERVSAEEIRLMAGELESSLGGVYSLFVQELQLPLLKLVMNRLKTENKLPSLPKKTINTKITTGLSALSRNTDNSKLDQLFKTIPPEMISKYLNVLNFIKKKATLIGVDIEGIFKTDEELQQEAQAAQQQQMQSELMSKGTAPAISAVGNMVQNPEVMAQLTSNPQVQQMMQGAQQ